MCDVTNAKDIVEELLQVKINVDTAYLNSGTNHCRMVPLCEAIPLEIPNVLFPPVSQHIRFWHA